MTTRACLDKLKKLSANYKSAEPFIAENLEFYIAIQKMGLRKDFIEITGWRDRTPWAKLSEEDTKRLLLASVHGYKKAKIFEKDQAGKYAKAQEIGVWHEMMVEAGWTVPENWSAMSDKRAKALVVKAAKSHLHVGAFQKNDNRYYKKAIELGCLVEVTAHMTSGRLPFDELTREEKKEISLKTAKEAVRVRSFKGNHANKWKFLKEEGLLKEALAHLNYVPREPKAERGLLEIARKIAPKDPEKIQTVAQAAAYVLIRLSAEDYITTLSRLNVKYVGNLLELLDHPLKDADAAWMKDKIPDYTTRNGVKKWILERAVDYGISFNPYLYDPNKKKLRMMIASNRVKMLNAKDEYASDTLLVGAIKVLKGTTLRASVFDFMWENRHVKLENIDEELVEDWLHKQNRHNSMLRAAVKQELLDVLEKNNMISSLYRSNEDKKRTIIKDALVGESDNVFYFVAKMHHEHLKNKKLHLSHLVKAKERFGSKKPEDFSVEDYNVDGIRSVKIKQVYRLMVKEGVAPYDLLNKKDQGYVFEDDIWYYKGQKLDFTIIMNGGLRYVCKTYYDKVFLPETSASAKSLPANITIAKKLEGLFAEIGVVDWRAFSNIKKQEFYDKCDALKLEGRASVVRSSVLFVRKIIENVKLLIPESFDPQVAMVKGEYAIPRSRRSKIVTLNYDHMNAVLKYIKNGEGEQTKNRLIDIATALQLITFRRSSEIMTMKIDALRSLGSSRQNILVYYSEKKKKEETVSLASLKGERKDPFADAMDEIVPSLLNEAMEITKEIRGVVDEELGAYVFIEESAAPSKKGLYCIINIADNISDRLNEWKEKLGLPKGFTSHQARHTGATRLIRTGANLSQVAAALGDGLSVTMKSYIDTVTQSETMRLDRGVLITTIEDTVKEIVVTKYPGTPEPMTDEQAAEFGDTIDVVGGKCRAGAAECFSCKAFRQTNGNSGCKGCALFTPTTGNLPYWRMQYRKSAMNLQRYRGTEFRDHLVYENKRNENILKRLEELADEYR